MAISIAGKAAIVTGAGRGIGRGIARVFAANGAKVVVVNRSADAGQAVVREIRNEGGDATFFQADMKKKADLESMAKAAIDTYGSLDVLCLNAGIYPTGLIEDLSEETWDDTIDTNLKGVFLAVQACVPHFKQQKSGRIVVVSSITGPRVGFPELAAYSASKGGVNGFIRTAALELIRYGVTINAVEPGTIATEGLLGIGRDYVDRVARSIPMGALGTPEDIAYALLFFASDQARYITGQHLTVDGGQILPESPEALAAVMD
jgi:3-oxoacyl-[acyl-carrier protein] reductase